MVWVSQSGVEFGVSEFQRARIQGRGENRAHQYSGQPARRLRVPGCVFQWRALAAAEAVLPRFSGRLRGLGRGRAAAGPCIRRVQFWGQRLVHCSPTFPSSSVGISLSSAVWFACPYDDRPAPRAPGTRYEAGREPQGSNQNHTKEVREAALSRDVARPSLPNLLPPNAILATFLQMLTAGDLTSPRTAGQISNRGIWVFGTACVAPAAGRGVSLSVLVLRRLQLAQDLRHRLPK